MKKELTIGGKRLTYTENAFDRFVNWVDPIRGAARTKARIASALVGGYTGAKKRRQTQEWVTTGGNADSDLLPDLEELRFRSRDLRRNNPLATGAINTQVTHIVGGGLKYQARIDAELLGMSEDEKDEWEKTAEREFNLWAASKNCDAARTQNFYSMQGLALASMFENGDVFYARRSIQRQNWPYSLALQGIEADRVSNKDGVRDDDRLAAGIETDADGAPINYHIGRQHPGALVRKITEWDTVPAYGPSGLPNIYHLFVQERIGQRRGAPVLAPVIESLKMIGRYTDAELMAAVVSGMFTVFIKSEANNGLGSVNGETVASNTPDNYKLSAGSIIGLNPGEDISTVNPGRPNDSFDPFVMAILRQVGAALELPYELLIKHFTASYSASRAAFEQAWKMFVRRRGHLRDNFCAPIHEAFMWEAVALGRISAPGFFADPLIRQAYLGAEWVGPPKGNIDPVKENEADGVAEDRGWKTGAQNAAERGNDWLTTNKQLEKERRIREGAGLGATQPAVTNQKMIEQDAVEELEK